MSAAYSTARTRTLAIFRANRAVPAVWAIAVRARPRYIAPPGRREILSREIGTSPEADGCSPDLLRESGERLARLAALEVEAEISRELRLELGRDGVRRVAGRSVAGIA